MKHSIAKDFHIAYGHRVWSQELDGNYADDLQCACRHLHGHEAKITIELTAEKLTRGMITDFRHLEWFKKFLNQYVDHKFILDKNDPLFDTLVPKDLVLVPNQIVNMMVGHSVVSTDPLITEPYKEYIESFFVVDFIPTSENLSNWIFSVVGNVMGPLGVEVKSVEWWESVKSRAVCHA